MTEGELIESGRRIGVKDVEIMILRQYEIAVREQNRDRLDDLKTAVRIVRELFPDLLRDAHGQVEQKGPTK